MRQRGEGPGEHEWEVKVIGRVLLVAEADDSVLEGKQHPRIDVEGKVQVKRSAAALLGMQVDLPDLTQGVGLDEVSLVMHVEPMVHGVVFELGYVAGDVDGCHGFEDSGGVGPC